MVDVVVIYLIITIVFSVLLLIMAVSGGIGGAVDFGSADIRLRGSSSFPLEPRCNL